jgi:outer membrane lipoprotein carrier protein
MRKFYFLLAFVGMGFITSAQTKSDAEAKKVLDGVSAKFKTFSTVQANFVYQVENNGGKILSTRTGKVSMKAAKYRVSFGDQEIFCDGSNIWTYDKNANEVTINKLDVSSGSLTPQKLFSNFYDKDFLYKMNGDKKVAGKTVQEIELTPKDKSKPFHKIYVMVDKLAKSIYSTKVLESSGSIYSYTMKNMQTNTAMADAMFVFDKSKYPKVEIVDLR